MTKNKQDELKRIHGIVFKSVSSGGVLKGSSKFAELQNDIQCLINSEVSQVLTDLLEHRSLLSDPQHGEKSVPVSVIRAKLKEYSHDR